MAAVLKELRLSGESAAAFGRRRGIRPQKLSCWRWPERFRGVRSRLAERLAETVSGGRPDHLAKIRWLIARFNESVGTAEFQRRVCCIEPISI